MKSKEHLENYLKNIIQILIRKRVPMINLQKLLMLMRFCLTQIKEEFTIKAVKRG